MLEILEKQTKQSLFIHFIQFRFFSSKNLTIFLSNQSLKIGPQISPNKDYSTKEVIFFHFSPY